MTTNPNSAFHRITAHGTASAFEPGYIDKSRFSVNTEKLRSLSFVLEIKDDITPAAAIKMGVLPEGTLAILTSNSYTNILYAPATTFSIGTETTVATATNLVAGGTTSAQLLTGVTTLNVSSTNKILTVTPADAPTVGTSVFLTVNLTVLVK